MYKLSKVSPKGGIIIPKEIREKIGLEPGMRVAFVEDNGNIRLVPVPKNPVKYARGMLKRYGEGSLTKLLLEERKKDKEREEAKVARWLK
ncbi:MAG: AbrB/MazE/SpoVT family DNA-binding domain-containing protein [Calditrichaeota bacterium]|nr:MAG: AbrB/MazE/SpoVT family DNA-binding domain-containing protein [Calditrichota bacterium]